MKKTTVTVRTGANRSQVPTTRAGYSDDRGQVFLPPKNSKKLSQWLVRYGLQ